MTRQWRDLLKITLTLKPIPAALDRLQHEDWFNSDAVEAWLKLEYDLQECLTEQKDLDKLLKRENMD